MVRLFRVFVVITVLVLAYATPAVAGPQVPIKGTVLGEHGPPDFTAPGCPEWALWRYSSHGVGQMSHLGRVKYTLSQCTVTGPDGIGASEGMVTFTAANGDELVIKHAMLSQLIGESEPPDGFTFVGTWQADGGTGRFAHATGQGTLDGVGDILNGEAIFDLPDGIAQFNFHGEIAYDASDRSK